MAEASPSIVVVGGPNGAGKSTTAESLLQGALAVDEFVNADVIARGISAFAPEGSAVTAGKVMVMRMRELARQRASFAFETTLASRTLVPWLRNAMATGYRVQVLYLWLPHPDLAVHRVRERVLEGGHGLPEETIRRRYQRGLHNFFALYLPLAASWHVYDNGAPAGARLVARGGSGLSDEIIDAQLWRTIESRGRAESGP